MSCPVRVARNKGFPGVTLAYGVRTGKGPEHVVGASRALAQSVLGTDLAVSHCGLVDQLVHQFFTGRNVGVVALGKGNQRNA